MGIPSPRSAARAAAFVIAVLVAGAGAPALANCEQPFLVPVAVRSIRDLLARKELRVVLVRGFDYGDAYLDMIDQLSAQGRLLLEKDGAAVARVLDAGIADVTLMAPTVFAGAILEDKRFTWMMPKLRIEPLEELPWGESGIYISKQTVAASDRAALQNLFAAAIKSGAVYENLKRYYPPAILAGGVRPR
ncbi:hypothetical protein PO883_07150 [Massilia sp. DJPM01]|uniref:hypothetical protein n=1 Tax=Massilia sp. DJPM01 TaxID=3024404 RepID=UPI00259DE833|nr:hypothetical protein [Massilia sp. DJPM01]MDM5176974.1 hypothetical protein [Massilia sp. DJPM01]